MDRHPVPDLADDTLKGVLAAVADPVRLQVVRDLADGEPHARSAEAWSASGVQESTLSHHSRALREAGLTRTPVSGGTRGIELRRDELDERFPGLVAALAAGQDGHGDRLR